MPNMNTAARRPFRLWHSPLVPLALVVACAGLRVLHLGAQSLWLDELFSVFIARREWAQVIAGTIDGDTNPPLFNLLLHVALQFGGDETAARAVSVFCGVASIAVCYAFTSDLFDARVALMATLLYVLNPLHIFYAQEARMYALLTLCTLGALLCFWRALQRNRARDWLLFALLMTLAFYTHSLAALNLLALDLFALTQRSTLRQRWRALVAAHALMLIVFLPWLPLLAQQATRVQAGFWAGAPSPLVLLTTPYVFLLGASVPALLVPLALFIALTLLAFVMLGAARAIQQREWRAPVQFALSVFLVPLLALYAVSLVRPLFVERVLLPASMGLYALIAWAMLYARERVILRALTVGVLLIGVVTLANDYFNPDAQKPPMREATAELLDQFQPGDAVAHTSDSSALAFMYYAPQLPNTFLAGDSDYTQGTTRGRSGLVAGLSLQTIEQSIQGHTRLWLVVALDHNEVYQQARVAEFDKRWKRMETINSNNIILILYQLVSIV